MATFFYMQKYFHWAQITSIAAFLSGKCSIIFIQWSGQSPIRRGAGRWQLSFKQPNQKYFHYAPMTMQFFDPANKCSIIFIQWDCVSSDLANHQLERRPLLQWDNSFFFRFQPKTLQLFVKFFIFLSYLLTFIFYIVWSDMANHQLEGRPLLQWAGNFLDLWCIIISALFKNWNEICQNFYLFLSTIYRTTWNLSKLLHRT